eukprot:110358-Prymnesium_polylepis.1
MKGEGFSAAAPSAVGSGISGRIGPRRIVGQLAPGAIVAGAAARVSRIKILRPSRWPTTPLRMNR